MKIKVALLDTAYSLDQIRQRGSMRLLPVGKVIAIEVERLQRIAEQVDAEQEYVYAKED